METNMSTTPMDLEQLHKLAKRHAKGKPWPATLLQRSREEWEELGRTWLDEATSRMVLSNALKELRVPATVYARLHPSERAEVIATMQEIISSKAKVSPDQTTRLSERIQRLHAAIEEYTWTAEDQRELNANGFVSIIPTPKFQYLDDDAAVERLRKTGKLLRKGVSQEALDNSYLMGIVIGWSQASNELMKKAISKFSEGKLAEAEALRLMAEEAKTKAEELRKEQLALKAFSEKQQEEAK